MMGQVLSTIALSFYLADYRSFSCEAAVYPMRLLTICHRFWVKQLNSIPALSATTKDQDFADRLHADLQNKGVRCWFAPHDIQGGRKIHEQIDAAIQIHDRLLLILSEDSMKSEWVQTEIAKARKREIREKRRMLFPVRLVEFDRLKEWECFDGDTGKDSAREIREYFVPDFSNWQDLGAYKRSFERLLADLKAETDGPKS